MTINTSKNEKTIDLCNVDYGEVFRVCDTYYIKTNEERCNYIICIDLSDGSFAHLLQHMSVSLVEASLNIN